MLVDLLQLIEPADQVADQLPAVHLERGDPAEVVQAAVPCHDPACRTSAGASGLRAARSGEGREVRDRPRRRVADADRSDFALRADGLRDEAGWLGEVAPDPRAGA